MPVMTRNDEQELTARLRDLARTVDVSVDPVDLVDDFLIDAPPGVLDYALRAAIAERLRRIRRDQAQAVEREAQHRANVAYWQEHPDAAPPSSRIYREWVRTTNEGLAHDVARRAAIERERQHRVDVDAAGGADRWLTRRISGLVDAYTAGVRIELTKELLATSFAVGDGRRVTWGDATVADHRARAGRLARQLAGTIETAARHEEAARMITDAGVACLADIATA